MKCPLGGECEVQLVDVEGRLWYDCRGKQFMLLTPEGSKREDWLSLDLHPDNISQTNGQTAIKSQGITVYLTGERERLFWKSWDTEKAGAYLTEKIGSPLYNIWVIIDYMLDNEYSHGEQHLQNYWWEKFRKGAEEVAWEAVTRELAVMMAAYKILKLTDSPLTS